MAAVISPLRKKIRPETGRTLSLTFPTAGKI